MKSSIPFIRSCAGGLLLLLQLPVLAQISAGAAGLSHKATIESSGGGPYFRLILPITIYPTAANADLTDVRVRNADGNLVPHAWLDATTSEDRVLVEDVPVYPVPGGKKEGAAEPTNLSLQFRQNANGSLLTLRSKPPAPGLEGTEPATSDWIIDASQIKGRQIRAQFTVNDDAEGLFPLTLAASDDLRHWRTINADAQMAVLKRTGGKIERLAVDLNENRAKFLRLRWVDPVQPAPSSIAITSATIVSMQDDETITPMQWSGPINASACAEDYCDYTLPAKTPLASLRINLDEPNTLAAVTISAQLPKIRQRLPKRPHPLYALRRRVDPHGRNEVETTATAETIVGRTVIYRLMQPNGEIRSEELALDGSAYASLRIRTDGPISLLGRKAPSIDIASTPRSLVFLGRGSRPFTLHWGVNDIGPALPLATLIPGYRPNKPIRARLVTVDIPPPPPSEEIPPSLVADRTTAPEPRNEDRRMWLWAALAGGLLLLAGMAWSLFRGMDKARKEDDLPVQEE
jgi:hypothetical protein